MFQAEKMSSEKSPALYIPTSEYTEKRPKKYFTKTFVSWVLAALLIALIVALCVQFAFPTYDRYHITEIDHIQEVERHPPNVPDTHEKPPWQLDFLINPTRLCETTVPPESSAYQKDPEVKLLVLVPSAVNHFEHRNIIRKTWGSVAQKSDSPIRVGFVLGTSGNTTEQSLVLEESVQHGDLIQADFADTYRNLTTKSVLMLKWVTAHCPHAQYFLKADDDTFVNFDVLSKMVLKPPYSNQDKFIGGFIHRGAQPSRNPSAKYYVSENEYPDPHYPPYASGSAYLTTGLTASQLFDATKKVKPFLPMEDIYVTGLCADEIAASLIHDPCFQYSTDVTDPLSWNSFSNLATAHSVAPDHMDLLWNMMTRSLKDTIALLEGGLSSSSDSSMMIDASPSIFDMLDLMGIKPSMSMSMTISNSGIESSSLEDFFNWPMRNLAMPDGFISWEMNDDSINIPQDDKIESAKKGAMPKDNSLESFFKLVEDAMNQPEETLNDRLFNNDKDTMFWPDMSLFPFGLNRERRPLVNITHILLK